MNSFFDKVKSFFAKATSTQKKNLLFLAVEVALVLMIATAVIAIIFIVNAQDGTDPVVTMASTEVVSVASEPESTVSDETIDTSSSKEENKTIVSYVITSQTNTTYTNDPYDIQSQVRLEDKEVVSYVDDPTPLTQWSDDRFLPALPEAANSLDYFVSSKLLNDEFAMFTSLKGIVNKTQPRIFTSPTEPDEARISWADKIGLKLNKTDNPYTLIDKYKDEIKGLVIYDDNNLQVSSTMNLATTIAGTRSALVCSPRLAKIIIKHYPEFKNKIIDNLLKHDFRNKWEIYDYMYENYLAGTTNRILFGLKPPGVNETDLGGREITAVYGHVRDYAIAVGANVVYLDPMAGDDSEILGKYMERMTPGKSVFMGWWVSENSGIDFASKYGLPTIPSDWCQNLSVYAGMQKDYPIKKQVDAPKKKLENKIYIALVQSDGDNLQYMEGFLFDLWNQPERGTIPMTYTMTPALADVYKPLLKYYRDTQTKNDCFVSGPSAYGYFYPKYWYKNGVTNAVVDSFVPYLQRANKYFEKLGWRSITVWNWGSGAMEKDMVQLYANNMPYLTGISQQENITPRGYLVTSKASKKPMVNVQFDITYASEFGQMTGAGPRNKVMNFDGSKPEFIGLQAEVWSMGNTISRMAEVKKYYEMLSSDVEFVRLDEWYQLYTDAVKSGKYKPN